MDGGREEATEERARGWKGRKQGRLRWGQRRGKVGGEGVRGGMEDGGLLIGPAAGSKWEERERRSKVAIPVYQYTVVVIATAVAVVVVVVHSWARPSSEVVAALVIAGNDFSTVRADREGPTEPGL